MQLAQPGREPEGLAALVRAQPAAVIDADELVRSPQWLPIALTDGAAVPLVRLDEAAYGAASFLDQRLLASGQEVGSCEPAALALAASLLAPRAHYIFHTGHVGSTLISRLVGAHPGFFALREPALLRELATDAAARERLPLRSAQALLSRTWRSSQRAVVKVTSFVSELAAVMLAAPERPVGIFMFARPPAYLRTILAGPNSRHESRELGPQRLRRLTRRFEERGWRLEPPRGEGEYIAMSWLCEMSALKEAALRLPGRALWVEFDAFLSEPVSGLAAIFRALGESPAAGDIEALVSGPLMRQYSKAPEHAYDAALRHEVLESAGREHAAEIRSGLDWLNRATAHDPSILAFESYLAPETLRERGMALHRAGRFAEALATFEAALGLEPRSAELCNCRGNALRRLRRLPEALASYDRAIALEPGLSAAHNNRGLVLQAMGRLAEAAASYRRALELQGDLAQAYNNLGAVECQLGEPAAALASFRRALELEPRLRGVHGNRGNALRDLGRPAEALAEYELALREEPRAAATHCNLGNALHDLGRLGDAIASYDQAIALEPGYAQAWFNKSVCLLLAGQFAQGLPLYEWRKQLPDATAPPLGAPVWHGTEEIAGRTLLIYADHGLGDTLQFCRYARLVQQRGARVVLRVQPGLRELVASLDPAIRVIGSDTEPGECDYQCALLSLPLAFGTTVEQIPATVPYLAADSRRIAHWGERLGGGGFKVGIAWQGSRNRIDVGRSPPLAMFSPLATVAGVRLISLQKGAALDPADAEGPPLERLAGLDEGSHAFLDSVAVMVHLDLVITSDSAIAHVAGALGRPTWVALQYVPDWRWLERRADCPWYPGMRLFRQSSPGDWAGVFAAIRARLARCAQPAARLA